MIRQLLDLSETDKVQNVEFLLRRGWPWWVIVLMLGLIVAYSVYLYYRETGLRTGLRVTVIEVNRPNLNAELTCITRYPSA